MVLNDTIGPIDSRFMQYMINELWLLISINQFGQSYQSYDSYIYGI